MLYNMTEERPWGKFEIILDSPETKVKRITVKPEQQLSYQYHHRRSEVWVIVSGIAKVVLEGITYVFLPGQTVRIPQGTKHRVGNSGKEDLVFIEVQTGDYFGEDDIVRIEDIYNRA